MLRRNTTNTDLTKAKKPLDHMQINVPNNGNGGPGRFKRSLSFSESVQSGQPLHEVLGERLLAEKRQCDMELRLFVAQFLEPLETQCPEPAHRALARLTKLIERMLALSCEQLRSPDAPCQRLIAKLRKLQTRWQPSWPGKNNITK